MHCLLAFRWDMDGAFQHGRGGEVSEWDTPVCEPEQILSPNPSLGIAVSRGGRTCAQCEITCGSRCHFGFTLSPSCWKVIRAFFDSKDPSTCEH